MSQEFRVADIRLDEEKWTPLKKAQTAARRGWEYYGSLMVETHNKCGKAGLEAIESQMRKAADLYFLKTLKSFNIPGNDARTIAAYFRLVDKIVWDMDVEVAEESPQRVALRWHPPCPVFPEVPKKIEGGPEACTAACGHEQRACELLNPKLSFTVNKLMTAGDPYCELIFQLED